MKHAALEMFKNVLFGVATALATGAGLFILTMIGGFNPQIVSEIFGLLITGAAFYFVGKTVREKFFKYK